MLPNYYVCSSCQEKFTFSLREAVYSLGVEPIDKTISEKDVFTTPVRPAWCKDCGSICVAEDIASLRVFEDAYAAVRSGRNIDYPVQTEFLSPAEAADLTKTYLHWRMGRRHAARALCCGGSNYQLTDVAQPLLKHAECEFGFIKGMLSISSHNGPGPGVLAPANTRLYNTEGELIGLLTWRKRDEGVWEVEHLQYAPVIDDQAT